MPKKDCAAEQIISKLRKAEVLINQGKTAAEASRVLNISEQTYYCWSITAGEKNMVAWGPSKRIA